MNKTKAKTRTRTKQRQGQNKGKNKYKNKMPNTKIYIFKRICQTQFSEARTAPLTGTRGLARVDGKTAVTTAAHERPMLGAGGTSFWRTVRATAYVG